MNENILNMLQLLDRTTFNHSIRVKDIAKEYEYRSEMSDTVLSDAALLHDIGKIYVAEKILEKPGKLTEIEREIINEHAYWSYRILKDHNLEDIICQIVLFHHGYSDELAKKCFSPVNERAVQLGNILHTIDAFEALTEKRVYRKEYLQKDALNILEKEEGHNESVISFLNKYYLFN